MKELKINEYECASCHNVYAFGWSMEEAKAEAEKNFGKPVDEWKDQAMVICDDCYKKMLPEDNPEAVEYAKTVI